MTSTIIEEIVSINRTINMEYRESKAPTFIKNFIAKIRRNKLKKQIEKLKKHNDILPANLLAEFIKEINSNFGKYQHCINIAPIESGTNLFSATFKIKIQDYDLYVSVAPETENNSAFIIRYLYSKDGVTVFSFTEDGIDFLEDTKKYDEEEYPYKNHVINNVLKDIFTRTVIDDIYKYLMDTVKRSERIGER